MGLAIQSTLEKGVGQTTHEFTISLVLPITPLTEAVTDGMGRLLAHGTTTCLIFEGG
jgi:acyl-coenzyme A thioesterase PaaI-like protein